MTIVGYVIFGKVSYFNYIGRIAFPIFAFQISQGYQHTKNLKNYILKLFIFAAISQIPFMLFGIVLKNKFEFFPLNIFFTLFLGLLCIVSFDKVKNIVAKLLIISSLIYLGELLNVDYGSFGVALIFLFYFFKDNKFFMTLAFLLLVSTQYYSKIFRSNFNIRYIYLYLFTLLPIAFICLYNKKQGRKTKYFLYIFYPVHLIILFLIKTYLFP